MASVMNSYWPLNSYTLDKKRVKRLMLDRDVRNADILKAHPQMNPVALSRHINGKGRNLLIQQAIADFLKVPLEEILQKPEDTKDGGTPCP